MVTRVIEIAGTHIHEELGELADLPGFRLFALQVSEWVGRSGNHDPLFPPTRFEPIRWLVVYECAPSVPREASPAASPGGQE